MINSSVSLNSNVKLELIDEHNVVKEVRTTHNRVTYKLVTGIMSFLQGSYVNGYSSEAPLAPDSLYKLQDVIPTQIYVGSAVVKGNNPDREYPGLVLSEYSEPAYLDSSMMYPINVPARVSRSIQRNSITDNNSGGTLSLRFVYGFNDLIGTESRPWQYSLSRVWEGTEQTERRSGILVTELGLYAGSLQKGNMLARVVFNNFDTIKTAGEDAGYPDTTGATAQELRHIPVFKSNKDMLVVTWNIEFGSVADEKYIPSNSDNT